MKVDWYFYFENILLDIRILINKIFEGWYMYILRLVDKGDCRGIVFFYYSVFIS